MSLVLAIALALAPASEPSAPGDASDAIGEAQPTEPDQSDADALERAAQDAFAAGRYGDTVRFAARAYELTGDVRHLYAQAHAERFRGDCSAALRLYARVMAAEPDGDLGRLARRGVELCEEQGTTETPEPEPAPSPAPKPEPVTAPTPDPASAATTGDDPSRDRSKPRHAARWIRDPLGGALLGTGVAAVAAGAGLWVQSSAELRASDRADDEATFADARSRARGFRIGAIVAFCASGALVTSAAVRYGLVARAQRDTAVSLGPAPGRGVMLGVRGRF